MPLHPGIALLEADVFASFLPPGFSSSTEQLDLVTSHSPGHVQASTVPASYHNMLVAVESVLSSTDSGCLMSDQSPRNSGVQLTRNCTSPSPLCELENAEQRLSYPNDRQKNDYLTLIIHDNVEKEPSQESSQLETGCTSCEGREVEQPTDHHSHCRGQLEREHIRHDDCSPLHPHTPHKDRGMELCELSSPLGQSGGAQLPDVSNSLPRNIQIIQRMKLRNMNSMETDV